MFDKLKIFQPRAVSSKETDRSLFSDENSRVKLKRIKPYIHNSNRQPVERLNNIPLRSNTEPTPLRESIILDPRLVQSVCDEVVEDSEEEVSELVSSSCLPSNHTIETSIPWNSQKLPDEQISSQLSCISNDNFHAEDLAAMPIDSELEFYTSQPQIGFSQAVSDDDDVLLLEDTIHEEEEKGEEYDEYDERFENNIQESDESSEEFDKHDILGAIQNSELLSPMDDEIDFNIEEILECSTQCDLSLEEEEVKSTEVVEAVKSAEVVEVVKSAEVVEIMHEQKSEAEVQIDIPQQEHNASTSTQIDSDELESKTPPPGSKPARKRLASKPLSSLCSSNQPRFRVGLSKRVKIDSLHTYLKKGK
ncbi:uncharacterized protein SPAPADRAFT_65371 [Spathaspora passalidarum NRRL Y-27907]|uniref:RAD51 interacting motif domain-containing protein n=1 Tax=Spathaspora passalidarum (strain NRRL Y-27907 / 11-Y1) TaxID=619300 RepID=G3AHP6_SPAPN|nr:uncharacterized protein SPAPADRAFT_65371 [Spathaspora passalidarum NRRL Y-27907]EGW34209.1 hypothetical protein SPAPADRAFT_65371 [Spathaspora passalidarum NRRL Y-27907]